VSLTAKFCEVENVLSVQLMPNIGSATVEFEYEETALLAMDKYDRQFCKGSNESMNIEKDS